MKIAFFGTPEFAIPSLERLTSAASSHKIVCVVCQPDKPQGRGGKVAACPVKRFGLTKGIPVLQPAKISGEVHLLDAYKPDVIVTCAFGQILRQNVLDYCKYGVVNVHASLLPKYRGSSPIQWAVANGEHITGVTIMQTDAGLDTGDIILSAETEIGAEETAGDLSGRLGVLGAELLVKALDQIAAGTTTLTKQNNSQATFFPMLSKTMARIDFSKTAGEICNFVRGMNPWPVAWFEYNDDVVRVFKAKEGEGDFCLPCKDGFVTFEVIQMPGGKVMSAKDYINGRKIRV